MTRWRTLDGKPSRIIAHRGASGLRPEHSGPAYTLALDQGADVIEPDLVISRDGVLVVRHDRELAHSTNLARHARLMARGGRVEQYDWSELAVLRARQAFPGRATLFDDRYAVLRFEHVLQLAAESAEALRRPVPVYPELKYPAEFAAAGLDIVAALIACMRRAAPDLTRTPVWVQCFDWPSLARVHAETGLPCYALVDDAQFAPATELVTRARAVVGAGLAGVAPPKRLLFAAQPDCSSWVAAVHDAGLAVHAWTYRDDKPEPGLSAAQEYALSFAAGIDALFCDFPASGVAARAAFRARRA
jgi:glycerophosphoryl diester phosphodiesterase